MPYFRRTLLYTLYALIGLLLAWQLYFFIQVVQLRNHNPATTALINIRLAETPEIQIHGKPQMVWQDYDTISPLLISAAVGAEDRAFMSHHGINFSGIKIAMQRNRQHGKRVSGASTITQQLAKNLFLSEEKTYTRKAQEAVIAVMMESVLSKRRILEIYLNVIEWGDGVFGAEAAAQYYFGISAHSLSKSQAALLAAIIASPRYYDRHRTTPRLDFKVIVIEGRIGRMEVPE